MNGAARALYILFCLAVGGITWSMGYALALALIYHDPRILHRMVSVSPLAPLEQVLAHGHHPFIVRLAGGALVPALVVTGLLAHGGLRRPASPLGDACFQDHWQLRRHGWLARGGKIFGRHGWRLLRRQDDRHHLIIGPTRSGKGVGYVIPNALTHAGSMIVTDLKGEIFASSAGHRVRQGGEVFLFAPGAARSHRYNPLDFIRAEPGSRTTDIQNIAAHLVPETAGSDNAVWQATSRQVMGGMVSYVHESAHYEGRRNLGEINALFNCGTDLQTLMARIIEREPGLSRFTRDSFNAYLGLPERTAASALLDVHKAMRPFMNERIAAATAATDMDVAAMNRRPMSIYLAPSLADITLLKPILSLFVQQALDILTREHGAGRVPVYFLLDEFRQLGKMSEITTKLPYVAGYKIRFAFVIQDLKSLDEVYGETARHSLLGNCGCQLVLGANDQATADYVSRALGKKTIRYTSRSRTIALMGLHRRTQVEQIRERDLMMSQEVRQMDKDRMVLLVEGQPPILGRRLKFYRRPLLRRAERHARGHVPLPPPLVLTPDAPGTKGPATRQAAQRSDRPDGAGARAALQTRLETAAQELGQAVASARECATQPSAANDPWSAVLEEVLPHEDELGH